MSEEASEGRHTAAHHADGKFNDTGHGLASRSTAYEALLM